MGGLIRFVDLKLVPFFANAFKNLWFFSAPEGEGGSVEFHYKESLDAVLQCSDVKLDVMEQVGYRD